MSLTYTIVSNGEDPFITVLLPGDSPKVARADHPNYDKIVALVTQRGDIDPQTVADLFDVSRVVQRQFERLSERVTITNGEVFLDGTPIDNSLTQQILRFLDEGVDDWQPLVLFMEKVLNNPNEHSREQLYTWLADRDFTITDEGDIVGYKGVRRQDGEGRFVSSSSGYGIVDGVEYHNTNLPNHIGAVVEMPRDMVQHDPSNGCSVGLHVGTHEYALGFGDSLLEVHMNPRDVVSVPTDCNWAKVRCCRYTVIGEIERSADSEYKLAVLISGYDDTDDEFDGLACSECCEYLDDCECGDEYLDGDDHPCEDGDPCECEGSCKIDSAPGFPIWP